MTYVKIISEFINSLPSVYVERFFDPGHNPFCSFWLSVAVIVCIVFSSIRKASMPLVYKTVYMIFGSSNLSYVHKLNHS